MHLESSLLFQILGFVGLPESQVLESLSSSPRPVKRLLEAYWAMVDHWRKWS